MKKRWRALFFLLGLAGLALMIWKAEPAKIKWGELLTPKILLILLFQLIIWAVIYFTHILVYKQILGEEYFKKVGKLRLFKITVSGFALNNVTPGGLVGGEPYRIMELKPFCGIKKATSTTLTFTVFYSMGHLMLWCIGCIVYFILGCPGETFYTVLLSITFVLTFIASLAFIRSEKQGFIHPVIAFFSKLPFLRKPLNKVLEKHGEYYKTIDDEISEFSRDRKRFFMALSLEVFSRLLEGAEYFVILYCLIRLEGTQQRVGYLGGLLTMSFASLVGNVFFFIPMQASTREGGMSKVLEWLHISDGVGVMTGLLYRVRDLLCIALGIGFILVEKRGKNRVPAQKQVPSECSAPSEAPVNADTDNSAGSQDAATEEDSDLRTEAD